MAEKSKKGAPASGRGRGRPSGLPAGPRHRLRCVVVGDELELVAAAIAVTGESQQEFTRRVVLAAASQVLGGG